jgi:hypothetical protein
MMKTLLLSASLLTAIPPAFGLTINFDSDVVGQPPAGWLCGTTGRGHPHWTVEADASAPSPPNVLKQDGTAPFLWCVKSDTGTTDGTVEVKFKPISGKEDQAGGVVWRWKDSNNYYVARANALENNVSLYYTVDGSRKTIKYVNAPVSANAWHTLRVTYKGDAIGIALDGKTHIETRDTHISGAGKAGVWTKADSVTVFDDFSHADTADK